jgi:hypothetical protein
MAAKRSEPATQNLPAVVENMDNWLVVQRGPDGVIEALQVNLADENITARDLDRITVPAGGGTTWEVPTLEGTADVKDLIGVILMCQNPRVYWKEAYGAGGGSAPPDCSSDDGVFGVGEPGGNCAECPLSEFGSGANGRSQACHQRRFVFFLSDDDMLPKVLNVPPASLRSVKKYLLRLANKGLPFYSVITRFGLEKTKNVDSIAYSQIVPTLVGKVPDPALFKKYADTIRPHLMTAARTMAREEARYGGDE